MADPKTYKTGSSSLAMGANSYTVPTDLGDQNYIMGQNVVCRGGIVQTRPGSRSLFCLPSGNFQGMTLFTPDNGVAQIVAAVDGKIYVSAAPFTSYQRLWNLQFSITAKYIAWAVCLKSTDYDIDGNIISLDNPYSVLVMQDGLTRAAYWDGGNSGHLNPGDPPAPDQTDIVPGYSETPIGLWMIWSGNRLWVSRGNQIFASDIGNPLKFTEGDYLNEARAFYLSGPCTGMIEVPSDSAGAKGFIAFTDKDGTLFQSYIQDRTLWLSQPLFQNTILPNVGCVAPRSLITQYGLNWWFAARGLTNLNAAFRQNLSSRIDYQDNQMFSSKAYLGPDLSGICASYYENYLMVSVPSGDVLNRHTWVLDQAPFEGNANAWTGFWSGWRPIEWARGIVNGSERSFFGSIDYDGQNRIWEAMLSDRTDNGCAITCYAQLRDHAAGNLDPKAYEWSKFFLSQVYGDVDLNIYVASTKGGYQLQKNYHLVASDGQIFADTEYSEAGPFMVGNRVQTRVIRTPESNGDNECNACGVESEEGNLIDYAFTHLLVWSGQMGIRAYQLNMRAEPEKDGGECYPDEVGPRTLNAMGCSGMELFVDGEVFEQYTAYAEGTTTTAEGLVAYIRRESVSFISQANAQALADCALQQVIDRISGSSVAAGVYDTGAAEVGGGTYVIVSAPTVVSAPSNDANVLIVGGGGASGGKYGGGGSGGQVIDTTLTITEAAPYTVTVGDGGIVGAPAGGDGGSSSFAGQTAAGGQGGGGGYTAPDANGQDGYTGSGGAGIPNLSVGGTGTSGFNGGLGRFDGGDHAAGGGGAGAAASGTPASADAKTGGAGGIGALGFDGNRYGGGGGGSGAKEGNGGVGGLGGAGGGGDGSNIEPVAGEAGTPNTGGGGGGGCREALGAAGGSGIVKIKYIGTPRYSGGTVTQAAGYTTHTFTSSGTLTPL